MRGTFGDVRVAAAAGASGETTFSFSPEEEGAEEGSASSIHPSASTFTPAPPTPWVAFHLSCHARADANRARTEKVGVGVSATANSGMGTFGGFAKDGVPRNAGRGGVPEHRSARDLPDPVGDSKRAFSPLSAALRTLPMTPCAVEGVGRGETEGAKISGPGGGGAGTGGGVASRGGRSSSRRAWSRGVARTSCDAYGLNGKCTS